jgi:hypothetical protein
MRSPYSAKQAVRFRNTEAGVGAKDWVSRPCEAASINGMQISLRPIGAVAI